MLNNIIPLIKKIPPYQLLSFIHDQQVVRVACSMLNAAISNREKVLKHSTFSFRCCVENEFSYYFFHFIREIFLSSEKIPQSFIRSHRVLYGLELKRKNKKNLLIFFKIRILLQFYFCEYIVIIYVYGNQLSLKFKLKELLSRDDISSV